MARQPHPYERDPQSGAGNCACGAAQHHRRHPHLFRQALGSERCVCALPAAHGIHIDAGAACPEPVMTGPERVRAAVDAAGGAR